MNQQQAKLLKVEPHQKHVGSQTNALPKHGHVMQPKRIGRPANLPPTKNVSAPNTVQLRCENATPTQNRTPLSGVTARKQPQAQRVLQTAKGNAQASARGPEKFNQSTAPAHIKLSSTPRIVPRSKDFSSVKKPIQLHPSGTIPVRVPAQMQPKPSPKLPVLVKVDSRRSNAAANNPQVIQRYPLVTGRLDLPTTADEWLKRFRRLGNRDPRIERVLRHLEMKEEVFKSEHDLVMITRMTAQKLRQSIEDVIPFSLICYTLDFLGDRDLARAEQASKTFQSAAMDLRLPPTNYPTVTSKGQRETVTVKDAEHRAMGLDYYRRARRAPAIVLYRQFDKKLYLNEREINQFTVSSFPWTPEKTAAWILGGIQSRKTFILITSPTEDNLWNSKDDMVSVLSRELMQLTSSGYKPEWMISKLEKRRGMKVIVFRPEMSKDVRTRLKWEEIWDRFATYLNVQFGGMSLTHTGLSKSLTQKGYWY